MRATHSLTTKAERGASSRAIEAAVSAYLFDPLAKPTPLLPSETSKALLELLDCDPRDLRSMLDCAADDPRLTEIGLIPLRAMLDEIWIVGQTTTVVHERVRFTLGARAGHKLDEVGPMVRDLTFAAADIVGSGRRHGNAPTERGQVVVYDPNVPTELNRALAMLHMAMLSQLAIVAASTVRRRKVPSALGMALVQIIEEGLSLFMPWLLLVPTVSFSTETRAKLPRLDFDSIFERHFRQMNALDRAFLEQTDRPHKKSR